MDKLTFPSTDTLAMVNFGLTAALIDLLVRKRVLTKAEESALYNEVADGLSPGAEMDAARTLLRGYAAG